MNFSRLLRVVFYFAVSLVLAGCAFDADAPDSKQTVEKGRVQAIDRAPAAQVSVVQDKISIGRSRSPSSNLGERVTALADAIVTQPMVLVSGRVTLADGSPVSSATIILQGLVMTAPGYAGTQDFAAAETDGDGQYALRGQDSNALKLLIKGDLPETVIKLDGNPKVLSRPMPELRRIKKDVVLAEAHELIGRVVDENGTAVAAAPVHFAPVMLPSVDGEIEDTRSREARHTTSTATGDFQLNNLAAGRWTAVTVAPGYAPVMARIDIPTTQPLTLALNSKGGTVRGSVVDKITGSGISGFEVHLSGFNFGGGGEVLAQETKTAADGTFQFDHVTSQPVRVYVMSDAEKKLGPTSPFPDRVRVDENQTTDVILFVYPGHTVSGKVYDKDTGEPLPGAKITTRYLPEQAEAVSDAEGQYRLENIYLRGSTSARLDVDLDNYGMPSEEPHEQYISVPLNIDVLEAVKDIPLVQMLTISGQVVTPDDAPIAHAMVAFISGNSSDIFSRKPQQVKPDGTFELETKPFSSGGIDVIAKGFGSKIHKPVEVVTKSVEDIKIVMEPGATVQGRVVDPEGNPVGGAEITRLKMFISMGYHDKIASSDENGVFTIVDAPTDLELTAKKEGYADSDKVVVEVKPGEVRSDVEIRLNQGHAISGRVLTADRAPAVGHHVSAFGNNIGSGSKRTDEQGRFKISDLKEGVYTISVSGSFHKQVENIPSGTTDLEIILEEDKEQGEGYTLIGTVVDDVTKEAIKDFEVQGGNTVKLREAGKFKMTGLRAGTRYGINITSLEYGKKSFTTEPAGTGETVEQTFEMGKGGAIVGRVVAKNNRTPVANVTVVNWGTTTDFFARGRTDPENYSVTDADGKFVLAPAPAGKNTLVIKAPDPYYEMERIVEVKSGETADAGDIELSDGGTIRGTVVRGDKEEPVPDMEVSLSGWSQQQSVRRTATSNTAGEFEFTGLPPMDYTITAGNASVHKKIEGSETGEVIIRVGGVTVSGTVTRGGQPIDASVSARSADGQRFRVTAAGGVYSLKNMLPGTYDFTISKDSGEVKETVQVPDQAEMTKDFALPDGKVTVTTVDESGAPVAGMQVSLEVVNNNSSGRSHFWSDRTTDSSGNYTFIGLNPGTYKASIMRGLNGWMAISQPTVKVQDNQAQTAQIVMRKKGDTDQGTTTTQ